jgi:transcription elongation factor Elf1
MSNNKLISVIRCNKCNHPVISNFSIKNQPNGTSVLCKNCEQNEVEMDDYIMIIDGERIIEEQNYHSIVDEKNNTCNEACLESLGENGTAKSTILITSIIPDYVSTKKDNESTAMLPEPVDSHSCFCNCAK